MPEVTQINRKPALSRALGVAGATAGAFSAAAGNPLGAASIPIGLSAAGPGSGRMPSQQLGPQVQRPSQGNALDQFSGVTGAIESAVGIKNSISGNSAPSQAPQQTSAMGRQLQGMKPNMSNEQVAQLYSQAERQLNDLRQTNPELAKQIQQPFFEGAFQVAQRYKAKQPIFGGGVA